MAAPSATARGTPGGIPLQDGYQTLITFVTNDTIKFWERTVTPPGVDGGDPIERTTMHNTAWRTFGARSLKTLTPVSTTATYDPAVYDEIEALLNVETTVTVTFADGSTIAFYGYLQNFEPSEVSEGSDPECTITIQPTNWDPTNDVEAGPTVVEVAGT